MLEGNMNISYYEVNTKHNGDFNRIIEYGDMKLINISEEEIIFFRDVMKQLGNNYEFLRFSKDFQEDVSFENVTQRM